VGSIDNVFFIDSVNVYVFNSSGGVSSQLRPNSLEDWEQLRTANPRSLLVSVVGLSLDKAASVEEDLRSTLGLGDCDVEPTGPGVLCFRPDDLAIYGLDMLDPLVARYPDSLPVVVGERAIAMELSNSTPSVWTGTADMQSILEFLGPGSAIRGASTVALDGCLSAVCGEERVVVGVSATTTVDVIVAAAIFDCAAAIFKRGRSTEYVVTGWTREISAIAADLAVLSGNPVRLANPLTALYHHGILSDLQWPIGCADVVIQPNGPQRLLRRGFEDWERLGRRIREIWNP
jgi:hypothetical protein